MNFALPENLAELSLEELSALITDALGEFNALGASDDVSDEALERLSVLADGVEALRAEFSAREAAAPVAEPVVAATEPASDRLAALRARVADVAPVAPVEAAVEVVVPEPATAVVAAAAIPQAPRPTPSIIVPAATKPLVVITAAADVPSFGQGAHLNPDTLADALHNRARGLKNNPGGPFYPVATIERAFGNGYDVSAMNESDAWAAIEAGSAPSALTASGGWCAPSETLYDLFEVECTNDKLFALPTYKVSRGGIRWPVFTPHDETLNPGFIHSEADDIAGALKPCVTIPCPTFTECRMDAVGLCIKAGNLMDRAYPEQIKWFVNRAVRAWERNNSIRKLNAVIADSIPVILPASFAAASAIISGLLLQAADYRETNGLCCGQNLDVVLPCWVSDLVKADIARQEGTLSIGSLPTDAQVTAWFAAANLSVSYINHWQSIGGNPATAWPATVQAKIGLPGSYLEFNGGRLDLGVTRDSTLNATNDFTAVWFEEFYCVGRRGPQDRIVTFNVVPNGAVGADTVLAGPTA